MDTIIFHSTSSSSTSDSLTEKKIPVTKATGRWTKDEHNKFMEGLKKYGRNWKQVEEYIGTRDSAQIRSHAQKFFNRLEREFNCKVNKNHNEPVTRSQRKYSDCSLSTYFSASDNVSEQSHEESVKATVIPEKIEIEAEAEAEAEIEAEVEVQSQASNLPTVEKVSSPLTNTQICNPLSLFTLMVSNIKQKCPEELKFPRLYDLVALDLGKANQNAMRVFKDSTNITPKNSGSSFRVVSQLSKDPNLSKKLNSLRKSDLQDMENINKKLRL